MAASSEPLAAARPERAFTLRVQTLLLPAVASLVEAMIVVKEDPPPPQPTQPQPPLRLPPPLLLLPAVRPQQLLRNSAAKRNSRCNARDFT